MNWKEYRDILKKELDQGNITQEKYEHLMKGIDIIES